jgi:hypothetical protein
LSWRAAVAAEGRPSGRSNGGRFGGDGVNTKNWYRKKTDLWAEFGKEMPFGRKISSKDSVEILAVGNTPSFGRRTVCA